jgi:hypothetical protein
MRISPISRLAAPGVPGLDALFQDAELLLTGHGGFSLGAARGASHCAAAPTYHNAQTATFTRSAVRSD